MCQKLLQNTSGLYITVLPILYWAVTPRCKRKKRRLQWAHIDGSRSIRIRRNINDFSSPKMYRNPFLEGIKQCKYMANFEGFSLIRMHCVGWCHISRPLRYASFTNAFSSPVRDPPRSVKLQCRTLKFWKKVPTCQLGG